MYDVRSMLARNNAVGRGAYASASEAGVAEELFDKDGFSYKELLQEYSGDQKKSSKRQSDSNRNRQQDDNHNQSLNLRSDYKWNTASASESLNGLALKNNAHIQPVGTAVSLSNTKLTSSDNNAKSENDDTNQLALEVSPNSDVYFNDVTVLRSAPSEANRENWLAGYAGKATLVSTAEVDGVQWATIKTGSGKLAYVRADELSATNPLVTATGSRDKRNLDIGTMLGVRNAVKLYKDTDEQSDYSGAYGDETGMEVLERTIKNGEEWIKVKTYSNDVGWCKAEQLCPLEEKLHTINNPSGDGYKLNLNVGAIPRSMIPNDLIVDQNGNIECKINAAYLKNSTNARVYYDINGIAYGTRGAEAFDLSELNTVEIVGIDGFTPDGWVNFRLSDGRTITINMADLSPTKESISTKITGDLNNDGKLDETDEMLLDDYIAGNAKDVFNADTDGDGQIGENDLEKLKNTFLVNKYDLNNDGKLDEMDGAILRNEKSHSGALTNMDKIKADFNEDGVVDYKDIKILDDILSKRILDHFQDDVSGIKGDVNNDGKVDFSDTYLLDKAITGLTNNFTDGSLSQISSNKEIAKQADIDGNGNLTYIDLMAIKKATNNYSDIYIFKMKSYQSKFYSDKSCSEISYEYSTSGTTIFSARVLDETAEAYKVVMQARTSHDAQEYWIKKSSIEEDLTPKIDKLVTEKMGIPIILRGYNEQPVNPIDNPVLFPNSEQFERIININDSFGFEPNGKVSVDSGNGVAVNGFTNDGKYYVNDVSFLGDNGSATITNGNLLVEVARTEYAEIDGTAKVDVKNGLMTINAEDSVKAKTIYENITVNTKGGNNEISVEGKSNTINTTSGTNTITVKGEEAHINCGNGKDIISVTKSANTMISNFNPDVDKIKFNPNVELKVEKMGQSVVVKAADEKTNNFIASFLGFSNVDKIQAMVNEHNANLYYDKLERELSEKIGNMFKKEIEPQYDAMKGMEMIDQFIKGANKNVPKEVLNKYKEYIADCLIDTQVSTDDVTNIANLAPKLTKIFGSTEDIVVGDYIISPVSVSFAKNGTFTADVSKKGSKIATLYMDLTDNKSVANAMKVFIEAAQKTSESALNTAIKEYLTEVDGLLGTNIGKAYDVGKGVIDLLYGQEQEKTNFNKMLASFKAEKLRELISATFGKDTLKTIDSLKEAKNNVEAGINFSKADEWKSLTSMFTNVEKMIAKLG